MKNGGNGAKTECSLATIEASWIEIGAGVGGCGSQIWASDARICGFGVKIGGTGVKIGCSWAKSGGIQGHDCGL